MSFGGTWRRQTTNRTLVPHHLLSYFPIVVLSSQERLLTPSHCEMGYCCEKVISAPDVQRRRLSKIIGTAIFFFCRLAMDDMYKPTSYIHSFIKVAKQNPLKITFGSQVYICEVSERIVLIFFLCKYISRVEECALPAWCFPFSEPNQ